jgi:serine protease DegQ
MFRWLLLAIILLVPAMTQAGDKKKKDPAQKDPVVEAKPAAVPFRLSDTNHTIVRVKINGKGPFNFVVDTGCPVMLISEPVGKKLGLEKGWAVLDSLEFEGGLELTKLKSRIETPFQIEGMNGMGLAGVELHGLMGYTVLAKYKMEFDYTKKQMNWTPVKTEPLPPAALGGKAASGGMDVMVGLVRLLTWFAGIGPAPPPQPRGFLGFEFDAKDKMVFVSGVLAKGPAAEAGLMKGDRIVMIGTREVRLADDVLLEAGKLTAGKTMTLTIERKNQQREIKITAGDGL